MEGSMDKKRILLVEDSDYRELVAFLLKRSGYDVAEATTGLAALEQANATRPDLIIMDLGLPGIMGDEATARLKADSSTRDIPVIVCTAFRKGALVERSRRWCHRDFIQAHSVQGYSGCCTPVSISSCEPCGVTNCGNIWKNVTRRS